MVYFKMQDLIGAHNCKEAYNEYLRLTSWLNTNVYLENWSLDYSAVLLINGTTIPQGIKFYNFQDATYFIRSVA